MDGTTYLKTSEDKLLALFLRAHIANEQAVSCPEFVLTWSNPVDDPEMKEYSQRRLILFPKNFPAVILAISEVVGVDAVTPQLDHAAELFLKLVGVRSDLIVFHEAKESNSTGITWRWIKRETMVPAAICLGAPMQPYIRRQELRVAEAASQETKEP